MDDKTYYIDLICQGNLSWWEIEEEIFKSMPGGLNENLCNIIQDYLYSWVLADILEKILNYIEYVDEVNKSEHIDSLYKQYGSLIAVSENIKKIIIYHDSIPIEINLDETDYSKCNNFPKAKYKAKFNSRYKISKKDIPFTIYNICESIFYLVGETVTDPHYMISIRKCVLYIRVTDIKR